ncbi:MAG: asparagine synthase (glutamine-hydrolyzing) [Bacteroidota bacterium]
MCGILGAIGHTEESTFKRALDSIQHRGPDGFGIWKEDEIMLGHRRLAILDLSENASQPFHYQHLAIVFNGEIYNFTEIKNELIKKNYVFKTESDTEVIAAAFLEWGKESLLKFNGMWALAIWNKNNKELFLARDRFGKKPLFYSFVNGKFIFASEMKAIFPFLNEVTVSEDFNWCVSHLNNYESTDKCLIRGIKRFYAGSLAVFKPGDTSLNQVKYWNTHDHISPPPSRYEEQVEMFREIFEDACRIRLRSDVSVGTALSGGVDSSAVLGTIAAIAKKNKLDSRSADWQHAFIATFPGTFLDETNYARKVVDYTGAKAHFLEIDPVSGIENITDYLFKFEEFSFTSPIPMIETYKALRKNNVVVSIDGHGADEMLAGYGNQVFSAFPDCGNDKKKIEGVIRAYNDMWPESDQTEKKEADFSTYNEYMINHFKGKKRFYLHKWKSFLGNKTENISEKKSGHFNTLLYELFHVSILPTLLRSYDRYSMASGVEIRMPFMDHRLVTFCFSLPWDSKLRNGFTKSVLRDAVSGYVPHEVIYRKTKLGFNTPVVDWMKGPWKEFLLDVVSSSSFSNSSLVNAEDAKLHLNKVINGNEVKFKDGERAWTRIMPYFWEQAMLNRK